MAIVLPTYDPGSLRRRIAEEAANQAQEIQNQILSQKTSPEAIRNQQLAEQVALQLQQAQTQKIQEQLANPNRDLLQAIELENLRYKKAVDLENMRQGKPQFSENLGLDLYRDNNGILRGRMIPKDQPPSPLLSPSLMPQTTSPIQFDVPPLTYDQPSPSPLSNLIQQDVAQQSTPFITGRLAQEEAARLQREQVARDAKSEETKESRKFKTSEREAGEEFVKGLAERKSSSKFLQGFDTKSGLYGNFEPDENGMFPEGVVPASQAPKPEKLKTPSTTQVEQLAAFDVLKSQIKLVKDTPDKVKKSNVGWLDSTLGYLGSLTGVGRSSTLAKNEAFRNAVDTLVGEYSFGRGGKALTVGEKEILARYLPRLIDSDDAFNSRVDSFGKLLDELKSARLQALEDSGYNVKGFNRGSDNQPSGAPKTAEEYSRPR